MLAYIVMAAQTLRIDAIRDIESALERIVSDHSATSATVWRWNESRATFECLTQFPYQDAEPNVPIPRIAWPTPGVEQLGAEKWRLLIPLRDKGRSDTLVAIELLGTEPADPSKWNAELERIVEAVRRCRPRFISLDLSSLGIGISDEKALVVRLAELIRGLSDADSVVWLTNKTTGRYEMVPSHGEASTPTHFLDEQLVRQLPLDVVSVPQYKLPWITANGLRLAGPLQVFGHRAGVMEIHFPEGRSAAQEMDASAEIVRHAGRALESVQKSRAVNSLNDALSRVAESETIEELQGCLLQGAFNITGCNIGAVLLLNNDNGRLEVSLVHPESKASVQISMDESITGQCLRKLTPVRPPGNLKDHALFKEYWPGMKSELAVPLYLPRSDARIPNETGLGTHISEKPKRIGVLNLESPMPEAFSQFEEVCLVQLAKTASVMFDRLVIGETLRNLHTAESELAKQLAGGGYDWQDVVKTVGEHIKNTLAFSHINISIVSLDGKRIKSEFVWWQRSEEDKKPFMELSDHELLSDDIQADVVRTKSIEVPKESDPRFHPEIHYRFGLNSLVRVYIPLMMGDVVVGTLEAGYRRKIRQFIFERDIQILRQLSDYVAAAIWKNRRGQLDVLRHEIAAPRKAIMDNALYLQRHGHTLSAAKIEYKLSDIFLDGKMIDSLLDRIEYYLTGRSSKETKPEFCNVGASVIIKTVLQQSSILRSLDLTVDRIRFSTPDLLNVRAVVDQVKAAEVFNNLLGNCIKYRASDESLDVLISVDVRPDRYLVRITDHGIGVDHGYEDKIFDEGIRAPSAVQQAQGSGLGLWLARRYMRDMGGDLMLESPRGPTVFRVEIIKRNKP